jgi:hypothetical protein
MKHPAKFDNIIYKLVLLAISIVLLIFLAERAAKAAFTFDEAATYLNYISANPMAIFNFNSANNHLVNTLLTKLAWTLGGSSEFVLRLPSLLAFVAYLLFSFLILGRFIKQKIIVVCGFLLLSVNPYILDFFSLCRGYGLSLAFLMAALFFFFTFIDKSIENKPSGHRHLYFSLASAALAVLCNFSLLNVYLGLAILAFGLFAVWNRQDRRQVPLPAEPFPNHLKKKKFLLPGLVLLAVLFNILVISQDLTLAEKFFEPVVVRITGPNEQEKQSLGVFRIDVKNQETRLIYEDDLWRMDKPAYFTAIKFRCLPDVANKIKSIEIRIGSQKFAFDAAGLKRFKNFHQKRYSVLYSNYSVSLKRSLFPIFRPVINWKGDNAFLPYFLLRMLIVLGILAAALGLFSILGRVLERWKILARDQFRPLVSTTLLLAAFIGYPLYILKRSGELYWGGQTGFIRDTVFSLINNSFYGNLYFRRQEWVIFLAVCLFLLAFLVVAFIHYRRKTLAKILPGLSLLAVLFFCSISTILQRALLHNPYLIGRTALFFIPVFMLLLLFLFRDLSRGTKGLIIVSLSLLALMAVLSVYHFTERANTAMTVEWRSDADTKTLLEDLTSFKERDFARDSKISLGIDDIFYPSLQYYLKRKNLDWLEVHVVPPYQENDFYYLEDAFDSTRAVLSRVVILKAYSLSGNLLVKPKQE